MLPGPDKAVRIVVHQEDAVATGKVNQLGIKLRSSLSAGGHARIVGPHHLDAGEIHCLKGIEVRIPAVLFKQIVLENFRLNH